MLSCFIFSRNEDGGIAIAQETEIVSQGIIVYLAPIAFDKGGYQQQQGALGLVEVGHYLLHYLVLITGGYDNLGTGVKGIE